MADPLSGNHGPKPPNVVMIVADDQSFDTIGAVNNAQIHSPNLRYLCQRGLRFENAYLMGSCVDAVCMPSRAMLHTGRSLFHLDGDGEEISDNHILLGEHLSANGYFTAGIGKWHNGVRSYDRSFQGGGPIFFGGMNDQWHMPICDYSPEGSYPAAEERQLDLGTGAQRTELAIFERTSGGRHSTELFAESAAQFVRSYAGSEPFFLNLAFTAPHDPRTMPQRYQSMYNPEDIELDPNVMAQHPFDNGELEVRDEQLEPVPRTRKTLREHTADYYGMISHIDEQLGVVIDALKARGELENTIIIYTADHGIGLGRHGLLGKQNLYDHSIHVPLLISGPGIPAGETRSARCYLLDLYPTICDMLNLPTPPSVEGQSLQSVISSQTERHRDQLFFAYGDMQRAVCDGRYKLIEYRVAGTRRSQLFDVSHDTYELCDLSSHPAYADPLAGLQQALKEAMQNAGDTLFLEARDT